MRAARYTTDESKDKTLQVQVRREVERIKRDNVDPAPLNPAATATSHTAGTRRRSETVTNAAATTGTTVGLALDINELVTSPLRKIRKGCYICYGGAGGESKPARIDMFG